jgi:hypothetical protein
VSAAEPKLAPPGAGLPWVELQVARAGFAWLSRMSSREKAAAAIAREGAKIAALARACDARSGAERVLIRRLPGLEDSSRFWSVFMAVEHVRVVNLMVAQTIELLGRGEVPAQAASTAAVKPDPGADAAAIEGLLFACRLIERRVRQVPALRTKARYRHPWFGLLDAGQWHFMAGFHMGLHREQIKRIVAGLEAARS